MGGPTLASPGNAGLKAKLTLLPWTGLHMLLYLQGGGFQMEVFSIGQSLELGNALLD